jgi:hypothetical protein
MEFYCFRFQENFAFADCHLIRYSVKYVHHIHEYLRSDLYHEGHASLSERVDFNKSYCISAVVGDIWASYQYGMAKLIQSENETSSSKIEYDYFDF